ncbi:MAG: DUF2490 domain-containing protein [Flavobacteriia bacterium]|nr:DUF2490 domain-containing protein [Flavobacteriia bacterium]
MNRKGLVFIAIFFALSAVVSGQIRREYWTDIMGETSASGRSEILFELSTRANSETQNIHQVLARATVDYQWTDSWKAVGGLAFAQTLLLAPSDFLFEARPFIGLEYVYVEFGWIELSVLARNELRMNYLRAGGDLQESYANRLRVRPGLQIRPFRQGNLEGLVLFGDAELLSEKVFDFPTSQATGRYRMGLQYALNERWTLEGSYFMERGLSTWGSFYRDVYRLSATYTW